MADVLVALVGEGRAAAGIVRHHLLAGPGRSIAPPGAAHRTHVQPRRGNMSAMALFGGPSADKILAKGSATTGRVTGIRVRSVSDGDSDRRVDEYAVEHAGGTNGIRQVLIPDDVVRLGMEVDLALLGGAGAIDWAATGRRQGFDGTNETYRFKALQEPPRPGIVDEEKPLATARKQGEPVTITVTGLEERSYLGAMAIRLTATVTVELPGTEPYETEIKGLAVPFYASHLIQVGLVAPGFVVLKRLDKPVIDWAAAANADPGLGRPPARPRNADTDTDAVAGAGADLLDGRSVDEAVAAAAAGGAVHGGIDLATYVAVEAGLQRDRVKPAELDAYAAAKGVPMGTWASASAAWQAAIRTDWRLGAAFGEAFEAERKRR